MTNNEAISRIKFLLDVGGSDGFTMEHKADEDISDALRCLKEVIEDADD